MRKRLIIIVFVLMLAGVGGLVYWQQYREDSAELYYSGTIEATQANLAFQVNGRVAEILVDEGQSAEKDQLLAYLDQAEFKARLNQAVADHHRSLARLKQLQTVLEINRHVLPAEVERAAAAVKALESQLEEAQAGFRPQEIQRARLALEAAEITMQEARKDKLRMQQLYQRGVVPEKSKDDAVLKYETALKEYGRAQEAFELAKEGFRKEEIDLARSKLAEGQAALKLAKNNLKKIEAAERDVEAARAQTEAAKAVAELAKIQHRYTELLAPFKGIIVSRNMEPGEVVSPGQEVLSIADLSEVDLKVFVDETETGKIRPGQQVDIRIDTFPSKTYSGRVAFISPEAEFTPKIIQTRKERVKLVYLVKIAIPNPNYELKTGMPADAWFH